MRFTRSSTLSTMVVSLAALLIGCGDPSVGGSNPPATRAPAASGTSSASKANTILQQQKAAAENVTRRAVELIKGDRMPEVRQLYKNRWNELAGLRTNVAFDKELTGGDKQAIERALRSEQESITEILTKYERLYGPGS